MHEACQTRCVNENAGAMRNERLQTVSNWRQGALDLQGTYQSAYGNPGVVIPRQPMSRKLDCTAPAAAA